MGYEITPKSRRGVEPDGSLLYMNIYLFYTIFYIDELVYLEWFSDSLN